MRCPAEEHESCGNVRLLVIEALTERSQKGIKECKVVPIESWNFKTKPNK